MSIFVIISQEKNINLENSIKENFPDNYYKVHDNQWLISTTGTAKEVSVKIGIEDKEKKLNGIIFAISGYWGRAANDIWEWIASKWEKKDG
jgi:hypothetical protein